MKMSSSINFSANRRIPAFGVGDLNTGQFTGNLGMRHGNHTPTRMELFCAF